MKSLLSRLTLLTLFSLPALASAADTGGNVLRFNADQLQSAARSGFPMEHALLEGFASLTLSDPQVRIPKPGERLNLQMNYDIALAGGDRLENGNVVVSSGLRYDPGTRGLHLVDPVLEHVGTGAAGRGLPGGSREALQNLIREYANTRPLYRLSDDDLAQVPGTLGTDAVSIADGEVIITLPPASAR
ncbi:DUF1439 domain-containing protein [Pseudoxanthomonas japonensis]|uniref:DUF1439 domain-containing protein n=1 Tax=Pseudoxanthomonas japonensis TaxID=69284 RepID=A0ABQ6ZF78_9GAMM|nr:DUF1439 domain-containing protein [Pseudoxanthomonas japonensis]KAF1724130.1 hypothetical protein CSC78_13495 [Pseudoxanthomonas japonensis]